MFEEMCMLSIVDVYFLSFVGFFMRFMRLVFVKLHVLIQPRQI